ncbi:MAG: tRNA lysidine(34) synthetase TilS [Desulfatibacillaceae bacterium]
MAAGQSDVEGAFAARVAGCIRRHGMFGPGGRVLVGVSGGPDSVALLHVLCALAPEWRLSLGVAHADHGLREDSGADAGFVRELAADAGLPFYGGTLDIPSAPGTNLEDAARRARYGFLLQTAAGHGYGKVAVGHHADDNAETVLMNFLRGSGPPGLGGAAPVRGDGVVRPLLEVGRADVLEYLDAVGAVWVEDETNRDVRFLRNRVRRDVMPLLTETVNPGLPGVLNRTAAIFREEEDYWAGKVDGMFRGPGIREEDGRVLLDLSVLEGVHPALARRVVRRGLERARGLRRITLAHVDDVLDLCASGNGEIHLPGGLVARCGGGSLCLFETGDPGWARRPKAGPEPPGWEAELPGPGTYEIAEAGLRLEVEVLPANDAPLPAWVGSNTAILDAGAAPFPFLARASRPGDRFRPLGAPGAKRVARYLSDRKVPAEMRKRAAVLLSGGQVAWLVGHVVDDRFRMRDDSARVVMVKVFLA